MQGEGEKKNNASDTHCTSGAAAPSRCSRAFGLMYKYSGMYADQTEIKRERNGQIREIICVSLGLFHVEGPAGET